MLMVHLSWMPGVDLGGLRDLLLQGDRPVGTWGLIGHTVHVATEPADTAARLAAVAAEQERPGAGRRPAACGRRSSRRTSATWRRPGARAEQALALGPLPPYLTASLHAELSQLAMAVGRPPPRRRTTPRSPGRCSRGCTR